MTTNLGAAGVAAPPAVLLAPRAYQLELLELAKQRNVRLVATQLAALRARCVAPVRTPALTRPWIKLLCLCALRRVACRA